MSNGEKQDGRCNGIHSDMVETVKETMSKDQDLIQLGELFKVFGDTTRISILSALLISELCVCDIAQLLDMTPSAISHQLRVLKQAKLVKNRRDGKVIFYSLDDHHIELILKVGLDHIHEK